MCVVLTTVMLDQYLKELESDRMLENEETSHFMSCCACDQKVKLVACVTCGEKMLCAGSSCKAEHEKTCVVSVCPAECNFMFAVVIVEGGNNEGLRMLGPDNKMIPVPSPVSLVGTILVGKTVVPKLNQDLMVQMNFGNMEVIMQVSKRFEHVKCIDDKIRTRSVSFDVSSVRGSCMNIEDRIPFPVGRNLVNMRICFVQGM